MVKIDHSPGLGPAFTLGSGVDTPSPRTPFPPLGAYIQILFYWSLSSGHSSSVPPKMTRGGLPLLGVLYNGVVIAKVLDNLPIFDSVSTIPWSLASEASA